MQENPELLRFSRNRRTTKKSDTWVGPGTAAVIKQQSRREDYRSPKEGLIYSSQADLHTQAQEAIEDMHEHNLTSNVKRTFDKLGQGKMSIVRDDSGKPVAAHYWQPKY